MDNLFVNVNNLDIRGNSEDLSLPVQDLSLINSQLNNIVSSKNTTLNSKLKSKEIDSPNKNDELDMQVSKSTVRERNAMMFNNELLSDVHFIVGSKGSVQNIPAHKYVLATGSSVFFAMFNGDLAKNDKDEIVIPDVEPSAFLALLKFLYCDAISLEADTVLATLYAAKKYIVPYLAHSCIQFLETSLTYKNVCMLLSQSCLFEEADLTTRCWEVIDAQAELALDVEGFSDLDWNTLKAILSRETLNVKEMAVFNAACRWAKAECRRRSLKATSENKRAVLGEVLYFIRIPAMMLHEFADGPAVSDILTKEEIIDIFLWYSASRKPKLKFPTRPRRGLTPHCCRRFQSSAYRSNQWRYRGRCDSIQFMAEKRIFVAGYGLYGSSTGASNYSAYIKLSHNRITLAEETAEFFSDGCSKTFAVWFHHPIQCEPNEFYTASVILDGNELSYFGQEGLAEVVCDGVTVQFQCSSDSTNGTGVQGGQIPELIFYHGDS